ncbi:hypothetical protein CAOG_00933 [Capsaspora owczarzaki ATCC 30864]|uniref:Uncharacterized protein n=1 Tax=Capsaspora owczarzaki (strain ATCC 30864) TaxID=595528 RepID=A0A0D2U2Q2_CAPO3|nr:hypothetical protein CAOG_00933 [Capsaspora owczarzaki ATCC 30864]KJE89471.1 hypothetical protein CAOG_000933 [Capsaspora owczarzaki ATCC 30864]|eukprot:XP_004365804.2 hypothetical protein CAOG_00933 [Capsaspora owczarzaki ATCC 30864]
MQLVGQLFLNALVATSDSFLAPSRAGHPSPSTSSIRNPPSATLSASSSSYSSSVSSSQRASRPKLQPSAIEPMQTAALPQLQANRKHRKPRQHRIRHCASRVEELAEFVLNPQVDFAAPVNLPKRKVEHRMKLWTISEHDKLRRTCVLVASKSTHSNLRSRVIERLSRLISAQVEQRPLENEHNFDLGGDEFSDNFHLSMDDDFTEGIACSGNTFENGLLMACSESGLSGREMARILLRRETLLRKLLSVLQETRQMTHTTPYVRMLITLDDMLGSEALPLAGLLASNDVWCLTALRGEPLDELVAHTYSILDQVASMRVSYQLSSGPGMLSMMFRQCSIEDRVEYSLCQADSPGPVDDDEHFIDCYDFPASALDDSGSNCAIAAM